VLFNAIIDDLMDAAIAMADGSYWGTSSYNDHSYNYGFEPNEGG
jgi:hypothetical protein